MFDPEKVAVGGTNDLETVRVVTHLGAEYTFPDISASGVKAVMPESGRIPADSPSLMMLNVSGSVLVVPFRVVKEVRCGEEVLWVCPA
jgi:hypothetical protein